MQERPVPFILCADVDPDGTNVCGTTYDAEKPRLFWRGVERAIPKMMRECHALEKTHNVKIPVAWFVRSDPMMRSVYGDSCWPRRAFKDLWDELTSDGHEIGWHPHLWRFDRSAGNWFQEDKDAAWIERALESGYRAFSDGGFPAPTSTRLGWDFMSYVVMSTLDRLGIKADLSSIPGITSQGCARGSSGRVLVHDWKGAVDRPYHPSRRDYRRDGKGALKIWEIPVTTFPPPIIKHHASSIRSKYLAGIRDRIRGDMIPMQLDMPAPLFEYAVNRAISYQDRPIVCYFHPSDLLNVGGMSRVKLNLSTIEKNIHAKKIVFVTPRTYLSKGV